ncbi:MAG: hypothetical protein GY944_28425, partial [bacterium]|nr:hypothetical protein [bacterium]
MWPAVPRTSEGAAAAPSGSARANLLSPHEGLQGFGDRNASVGSLVVFEQGEHRPGVGDRGSVQGMEDLVLLAALALEAKLETPRLKVGAVRRARDLAPLSALAAAGHPGFEVELAIGRPSQVARGGILRRGLPTRRARVAIVTNVAADHLGQYGVNTVPELARAKFAVHRALGENGVLALNADDPFVVAEAASTRADIWWFSLDTKTPQIKSALAAGQPTTRSRRQGGR